MLNRVLSGGAQTARDKGDFLFCRGRRNCTAEIVDDHFREERLDRAGGPAFFGCIAGQSRFRQRRQAGTRAFGGGR